MPKSPTLKMSPKHSPKIGVHVSVAGGIHLAPARAVELGCETFQCFTRPPQGGPAPKLTDEIVRAFKKSMENFGIETFYIHTPYILNLASLKPATRHTSRTIIRQDLERGSLLGASAVMTHIGSHADQTLEEGIEKACKGFVEILEGYTGSTKLLIEISAGAGSVLGDTFEEIGEMVRRIKDFAGFGGVCFDTCHAFAAGYDFRTPEGAREVLKQFDHAVGLEHLKLSHVNDSQSNLGGKRDRHEHIGEGHIGRVGMNLLLTTDAFRGIDWILETEPEGREHDVAVLKEIRMLP